MNKKSEGYLVGGASLLLILLFIIAGSCLAGVCGLGGGGTNNGIAALLPFAILSIVIISIIVFIKRVLNQFKIQSETQTPGTAHMSKFEIFIGIACLIIILSLPLVPFLLQKFGINFSI